MHEPTEQRDTAKPTYKPALSVSVVICTLDRPEPLRLCIAALSKQTRPADEVIVVSGSAGSVPQDLTDGPLPLKVVHVTGRNICVSRNAGVNASHCDIVAFCDDDAIPDDDWLEKIIEPFNDPSVAAIGGVVYDARKSPPTIAFANGMITISGRQKPIRDASPDNTPPRGWYNNVCGCNCAFRRCDLIAVGSFDEFIEFAFDETDVCMRLANSGRRVAHAPKAVVQHGYAPGGHREDDNLARNWYAEIKNQLYCGLKNATGPLARQRVIWRTRARYVKLSLRFARAVRTGRLSREQAIQYRRKMCEGLRTGLAAGLGVGHAAGCRTH